MSKARDPFQKNPGTPKGNALDNSPTIKEAVKSNKPLVIAGAAMFALLVAVGALTGNETTTPTPTLSKVPISSPSSERPLWRTTATFKSGRSGVTEKVGVDVFRYNNANGDVVYQAKWDDGYTSKYVFWQGGRVEIFSEGEKFDGRFTDNGNGVTITSEGGSVTYFPRPVNPIQNS